VLPQGHADRERLRSELIAAYLPVARTIARKYGNRGENLDDVEHVASVGLVLAVDRFQPRLGSDFLSLRCRRSPERCCGTSGTGPTRFRCRRGCGRFR
jgi:DNA-directed RNA polymerase specialized sigma subunit